MCFLSPIFGACKKDIANVVVTPPTTTTPTTPTTGTDDKLIVYPQPGDLSKVEHLAPTNDYTVEVRKKGDTKYQTLFVYETDNYWVDTYFGGKPKPQLSASFTSFAFKETAVDVKITYKGPINSFTVRPLNFGINPVREGGNNNVITFTLTEPRKVSIEFNDRTNPLFLFAETPDVENKAATYYYGPGVHNIGLQKTLKSNESVYIAAWGGPWGRLYYLANQASTSGILFENINLIGKDGGVELIQVVGDKGTNINMSNITFKNLRVEAHPKTNSYTTNKFIIFNSGYKSVTNWLFEDVTIDDKNPDEGDFYGTADSPINGVKFKNLKIGGVKVNSLSEGNMDKNEFATNITFE